MKTAKRTFVATGIMLGLCVAALEAAPALSGISGRIEDGQVVTITGSGFGAGPTVKIFDDYESGSAGQTIDKGVIGTWDHWAPDTASRRKYSNAHAVSGSQSDHDDHPDGGPFMGLKGLNFSEAYMSFWVRPTVGWHSGANWKIATFQSSAYKSTFPGGCALIGIDSHDNNSGAVPSTCTFVFRPAGNPLPGSGRWASWIEKDKWVRISMWWKGSTGNDGRVAMHMMTPYEPTVGGGAGMHTIYETGPRQTRAAGSVNFDEIMIGYYGGKHPHFDDSYIAVGANSCARVEITNSPDYEKSTKMGIITIGAAGNSWSNGQIKATCHPGSLRDGDEAWVYVFDSNNNRSEPFAVTIGESLTTEVRMKKWTNGRVDQWTTGICDILGRRVMSGKTSARKLVVIRGVEGKIVRELAR